MFRILTVCIFLVFIFTESCIRKNRSTPAAAGKKIPAPTIAISPLERGRGQWLLASASEVAITVTAPGASQVLILSLPEGLTPETMEGPERRRLQLFSLGPTGTENPGKFIAHFSLPPDFASKIWAEVIYPDGMRKETETLALASDQAKAFRADSLNEAGGSIGTDESARSDKLTGGRIKRATFKPGESDIRITVNLPAFTLTLWQKGAEVGVYRVGIGRKDFPVPVGERETSEIVFNPAPISPESVWSNQAGSVLPLGRDASANLRNPLGLIKIPIGEGYSIHEVSTPLDLGGVVSGGCIRMLREDLSALTGMIIAARNPSVTKEKLELARQNNERLAVKLDAPLLVDINYDLQVIENRRLHLYPDVYGRGAFALDGLRAELLSAGLRVTDIPDSVLQGLLNRVEGRRQLILSETDIKRKRWSGGIMAPIIEPPVRSSHELSSIR